jgi:hypothetical protein
MVYDPNAKIVVKVEVNTALGWVDVTSRGRAASCVITQGRSANSIQAETSRLQLTLGNPDGYLTEDNAVSPYYGSWGRGCEIRMSRIGLTVSPAERFHGQVDSIVERFPGGDLDATVEVTAIGTLGILAQGSDSLRSPLTRAMAGISEGDFVPIAYWPMEDGSDATSFASYLSGQPPATFSGSVSPASYSGFAGSKPLPILNGPSQVVVPFPVYADTGHWQFQFTMMIPSSGFSNDADLVIVDMVPGHLCARVYVTYQQSSGRLVFTTVDVAGNVVGAGASISGVLARDTPYLVGITDAMFTGDHILVLNIYQTDGVGLSTSLQLPDGVGAGSPGMPFRATAIASTVSTGWSFGHAALLTDDIITTPSLSNNAPGAAGFPGETAGDRMIRLCREEGVPFQLTGNAADTPPMGPQLIDTLIANLRDCELADQGLMHDNGTDGAIVHVTRAHLYDQAATIAVVRGSIEENLEAIRDRQYGRNDITSNRPGGGSARVADEEHVAKIRARIKDSRTVNVQADDQLSSDASWAVHLGTAAGARYNSVGINLRNADGALLADSVAAHAIGDRITVAKTALPPQHHIDGIDGLTVGWTEILDAVDWRFAPNVMPYAPYDVARYDTGGDRYDSANTFTIEDLDTTETDIDAAVTDEGLQWSTTASGYHVGVGGEKMLVSAVGSLYRDTFSRSVSNSWSTADSGQVYTSTGGVAADFSVNGSKGFHTLSSVNVQRWSLASVTGYRVRATANVSATPTGAALSGRVITGSDTSNHYGARLDFNTDGTVSLLLIKTVAGVGSALTSSLSLGTFAVGDQWTILLDVIPGESVGGWAYRAGTTIARRMLLRVADTSVSAFTAVGIGSRAETGNTNVNPIVAWDNAIVLTPQRFTVTRSVNGVVKTHTAGAQLRLWTPPYYGY